MRRSSRRDLLPGHRGGLLRPSANSDISEFTHTTRTRSRSTVNMLNQMCSVVLFSVSAAEPHLLPQNIRAALFPGGSQRRSHADLDGRYSHGHRRTQQILTRAEQSMLGYAPRTLPEHTLYLLLLQIQLSQVFILKWGKDMC